MTAGAVAAESGLELKKDQLNEKRKIINSGLAGERESAVVTCVSAESQRQTKEWKNFTGGKKEAFL